MPAIKPPWDATEELPTAVQNGKCPPVANFDNHQMASCHRHRSSSAINGFEDDNAMLAAMDLELQAWKNSDAETNGRKGSQLNGWEKNQSQKLEEYVKTLDKSCNRCGMVWPKKQNGLRSMVIKEQQFEMMNGESHDNDGNRLNGHQHAVDLIKNPSKSKCPVEFDTNSNLVKSRISFFERKDNADLSKKSGAKLRSAKSMSNLFDEKPELEKKEERVEVQWKNFPTELPKVSKCPFAGKNELKNIRLKNYVQGTQLNDTLHRKSQATHCKESRCMGSLMYPYGGGDDDRPYGVARKGEEVKRQAVEFLDQYYASIKQKDTPAHQERLDNISREIAATGRYDLTFDELSYGAKLAWRNAARCIGRIQWNNLKLFDARSVETAKEMFDAICEHLDYATNGGNLRSTITIFRERREGQKDFRLWNSQLIRYAGYEQDDGSIIGDPAGVEFAKLCMKLGWKAPGGRFDVVPLVIQAGDQPPQVFDIPKHLALEVQIKHPDYPWFEDLGLQWYALPAVANMKLDLGGIEFPCSPFNGWYMVTEIGARDLGDSARYNMLEPIAKGMNLDTRSNASLWKDRAVTELNHAVLHSFKEAKVTLVDHHTASESFIKHMQNEQKLRGGCPADWVWIVPPSSSSTTEVFHQEMLNYLVKPSYDYQDDAWKHYQFEDEIDHQKMTFKQTAILVKVAKVLMNGIMAKREKATVLYATETGKSENFAKILGNLLSGAFDVKVLCMADYEFSKLHQENLLMVVTSTFGNGEAPMNGEGFGDMLYKLGNSSTKLATRNGTSAEAKVLEGMRFAVFGLGSSAYPSFCAFAHSCRNLLHTLGATEIHPVGEGDELCGQEESFKKWAKTAFKAACDEFAIDQSKLSGDAAKSLDSGKVDYDPANYKFAYAESEETIELCKGLSSLHGKEVQSIAVNAVEELQSERSSRSTVLVKLEKGNNAACDFEPGDHLAIFPSNEATMVEKLIGQLNNAPDADKPIRLQISKEASGAARKNWEPLKRLPEPCTLRQAFTNFIDITTPPTQDFLKILATMAKCPPEQETLKKLSEDSKAYEEWKYEHYPTITDVLDDFKSVKLSGMELLTQLPLLQLRYYSISSSPLMYPNEIHATVAVVRYETQGKPKRIHNGVCSFWLSNLKAGDLVPCFVRQATSFRLPSQNDSPVIMVGPGTGIAPLRSFWQHRQMQREAEENKSSKWGSMDLYAGCRASAEDNIYEEEKAEAVDNGTLSNAYLALSREPGVQKTYVQHMVAYNGENVCDKLMKQGGHIYVCGDVAMAADVNTTICQSLQERMGYSKEQARECIKKLKSSGRYHEDIFGVTKIPTRSNHQRK